MSYEIAQIEYDNMVDDLMGSTCHHCRKDFSHNCDSNNIYCKYEHESLKVYCEECLDKHDGMCVDCWEFEGN